MSVLAFPDDGIWIWVAAYALAIAGSGVFVELCLRLGGQSVPVEQRNPGRVIGKIEDFLIITFVILEAYTALALIFAAKGIVRAELDRPHSSYYILGTLANFAWALAIGLVARLFLAGLIR